MGSEVFPSGDGALQEAPTLHLNAGAKQGLEARIVERGVGLVEQRLAALVEVDDGLWPARGEGIFEAEGLEVAGPAPILVDPRAGGVRV
jgi:hypothetical protein